MFVKSVNLTSLVLDIHFLQSLAKPWQDGGEAHQICVCECLGVQARGPGRGCRCLEGVVRSCPWLLMRTQSMTCKRDWGYSDQTCSHQAVRGQGNIRCRDMERDWWCLHPTRGNIRWKNVTWGTQVHSANDRI